MSLDELMGKVATQVENMAKSQNEQFVKIEEATDNSRKAIEALAAERKFAEEIQEGTNKSISELKESLEKAEKKYDEYNENIMKEVESMKMSNSGQDEASLEKADVEAFLEFMRKGDLSQVDKGAQEHLIESIAKNFEQCEPNARRNADYVKAYLSGVAPQGGYVLAPAFFETSIQRFLQENTALYGLAMKTSISNPSYQRPAALSKASANWVGETDAWKDTKGTDFGDIVIPVHKLMARPSATQDMLEDAMINMEAEIMNAVNVAFEEEAARVMIYGDGQKKPMGLLSYKTQKAGKNPKDTWGYLEHVTSGAAEGFAAEGAFDALIELQGIIKSGYLPRATWLMNRSTATAIRKFKDKDGNYIWEASTQKGIPGMLLGYDVAYDANMPNVASGTIPIAFGDFNRGLLIVNRRGITMERDTITRPGQVIFNTSMRMGFGVQDFDAIKLLKIGA